MRYSQLRSSYCLLLPHPLLICPAMFLSLIPRRMMRRTLRRILPIILPTKDMMATMSDKDESSDDDEDDDVDIKGDEEEEEHPVPADSTAVALPAVDHASSVEETGPFEIDESAVTPPPHPVARLLAIPIPPPSPLSPWSSPLP
ncbi:hypothetical protein Tco_1177682 [Tanacetum coccineum]